MSLLRLSLVVTVLAVSVILALTNPTTDQYLVFVQSELTKVMDRMDQYAGKAAGSDVQRLTYGELINSVLELVYHC